MRFERGADPSLPAAAMERACELLTSSAPARCGRLRSTATPPRSRSGRCGCDASASAGLLGVSIPDADVERILASLGFSLQPVDDGWEVTVPTRRVDVVREVDLHRGDRAALRLRPHPGPVPRLGDGAAAGRSAHHARPAAAQPHDRRRLLRGGDLRLHRPGGRGTVCGGRRKSCAIANPLSENFAVLRPSLLPGPDRRRRAQPPARAARRAAVRGRGRFSAQAAASAGRSPAPGPVPRLPITGAAARATSTSSTSRGWSIACAPRSGSTARFAPLPTRPAGWPPAGPPRCGTATTRIGVFGQLSPQIADGTDCRPPTRSTSRRSISTRSKGCGQRATSSVEPLPRYPSVNARHLDPGRRHAARGDAARDDPRRRAVDRWSACASSIAIRARACRTTRSASRLRLTFRAADRTLTDAEVQGAMDAVLAALREHHDAVQR